MQRWVETAEAQQQQQVARKTLTRRVWSLQQSLRFLDAHAPSPNESAIDLAVSKVAGTRFALLRQA
jgi:hypothetical protein